MEDRGGTSTKPRGVPILLVSNGPEPPAVVERFGEFDSLITTALRKAGVADVNEKFDFKMICSYKGEPLPSDVSSSFAAVLLSGSFHNVTAPEPWMAVLWKWLNTVRGTVPILGICFGHQSMAHAFGGRVDFMASGVKSNGSIPLETKVIKHADSGDYPIDILRGLPNTFLVSDTHTQAALELPPAAVSMGGTHCDPNHLVAYDGLTFGCQFHPEYPPGLLCELFKEDGKASDEAIDEFEKSVVETPESRMLLLNFLVAATERYVSCRH